MIHLKATGSPAAEKFTPASEDAAPKKRFRNVKCVECGKNPADLPSLRCVGCDAYRDHTGHF